MTIYAATEASLVLRGACQPGAPLRCENAATCVEGASAIACAYPDSSAWLVYEADEDTPALDELYAVKESLIGIQQPIKISVAQLRAPTEHLAPFSFSWSADGRWLMYGTTEKDDTVPTRWHAVRFDGGVPQAPVVLTDGLPPVSGMTWSPTGHELLFRGNSGSLYWVRLNEGSVDARVNLNPSEHLIKYAIWATNGRVVYTTTDSAAYRVSLGDGFAYLPFQFTSSEPTSTLDLGWASQDGAWMVLMTGERTWLLANVNSGRVQRLAENALEDTWVAWQFSPDSRYLLSAASEQVVGLTEVYLTDLRSPGLIRSTIDKVELTRQGDVLGSWAPDSSFFTYFGEPWSREPGQKSLKVYDVLRMQRSGTNYDVGLDDRAVGFSPDQSRILYSTRWSSSSTSTDLVGIDRDGREQSFDEDAAGRPYSSAEFAPNGLAALYCTTVGTDQLTDMVFSDRRPPLGSRAVRVPGEGSVYSCTKGFAPDSRGFAYYRFAPDGSRTLYWVDITKQVMSKPLPISREGRVLTYQWQPSASASN